jgi:hypothetical protein
MNEEIVNLVKQWRDEANRLSGFAEFNENKGKTQAAFVLNQKAAIYRECADQLSQLIVFSRRRKMDKYEVVIRTKNKGYLRTLVFDAESWNEAETLTKPHLSNDEEIIGIQREYDDHKGFHHR